MSPIQHNWMCQSDSNSKFEPANNLPKPADIVNSEGLQSSLMASYDLLRGQWERNVIVRDRQDRERRWIELKERQRIELVRKQRQRLENERLFQAAVAGWYFGLFYFVLAVMIAFALFVCSLL